MPDKPEGAEIPQENVFGGAIFAGNRQISVELIEDLSDGAVKRVEQMVGFAEIGAPAHCMEQVIADRVYRDVYKSYPYYVLSDDCADVRRAVDLLVSDARREVERWSVMGFKPEQLGIFWRLEKKIAFEIPHCFKCGGGLMIRTRYLIRPDREGFVTGFPADREMGYVGRVLSESSE